MKTEVTRLNNEFDKQFPNDASAEKYMERCKWGPEPTCPHCDSKNIETVNNRIPLPYRCRDCSKHFSFRTSSVMHNSFVSPKVWLKAAYLLCHVKNPITYTDLSTVLNVTHSTAQRIYARIHRATRAER